MRANEMNSSSFNFKEIIFECFEFVNYTSLELKKLSGNSGEMNIKSLN